MFACLPKVMSCPSLSVVFQLSKFWGKNPLKSVRLLSLALCLQKLLYTLMSWAMSQGIYASNLPDKRGDKFNSRACFSWNYWCFRLLQIMYCYLFCNTVVSEGRLAEVVERLYCNGLLTETMWEGFWIFQIQMDRRYFFEECRKLFWSSILKKDTSCLKVEEIVRYSFMERLLLHFINFPGFWELWVCYLTFSFSFLAF